VKNRLGNDARVYPGSTELAAVTAVLGKLPNVNEYQEYAKGLSGESDDIYRYLNFDQMEEYQ